MCKSKLEPTIIITVSCLSPREDKGKINKQCSIIKFRWDLENFLKNRKGLMPFVRHLSICDVHCDVTVLKLVFHNF